MDDVNREYKDRLFKFIFGNPNNKAWTLSLYNAINHTDYLDPDEITFTTIEDAVYMGMKNDVSFLVANSMNMYEQQSTYNPNIPLRILIYAGMMYSRHIAIETVYRRYSTKQQMLPTPKCVCFYNGTTEKPDVQILSLRNAFEGEQEPDIDVRVTMLNINYKHSMELLAGCEALGNYSWFVDKVRENETRYHNLSKAVDSAIADMPDSMVLKSFLIENQAEVRRMCITEYNEARTFAEQREEGREEGLKEGREEGLKEGLKEGRAEGVDQYNTLLQKLFAEGRGSEVECVIKDEKYREQLMRDYGLT